MRSVLLLIFLLTCCNTMLFGQSVERYVIGATGGTYTSSNYTHSNTLGQPLATTSNFTSILVHGYEQPEVWSFVNVQETAYSPIEVLAYPNPTRGNLDVRFTEGDYQLTLFSLEGKQVVEQNITAAQQTQLQLSHLQAGVYLLQVVHKTTGQKATIRIQLF